MLRIQPSRFAVVLALAIGLCAPAAQAKEYRYRYIDLDQATLPDGFLFFDPKAIDKSGQKVYGETYDIASFTPHVAVYENGAITLLQPEITGMVRSVNAGGTIGANVFIDFANFTTQAALFRRGQVQPIPFQPGEFTSSLLDLNDANEALVESTDTSFNTIHSLYKKGKNTVLNFGLPFPSRLDLNNQSIVSGTTFSPSSRLYRGFRHDPRSGQTIQLAPLPTEPHAWALGINNRGDVLGYSFFFAGLERIGTWDKHGNFKTYFTEGTPAFPTISNSLLFNDNNLIVISWVSNPPSEREKSYLVPAPGVRLELASLVENLPANRNVSNIYGINNRGDMIGYSMKDFNVMGVFLLKRLDASNDDSSDNANNTENTLSPSAGKKPRPIPPQAASIIRRRLQSQPVKDKI